MQEFFFGGGGGGVGSSPHNRCTIINLETTITLFIHVFYHEL